MAKRQQQRTAPVALGTVYTAGARIQVIEDRPDGASHWKTLAECLDTPNAIKAEVAKLRARRGGRALSLWVKHQYSGREYIGQEVAR